MRPSPRIFGRRMSIEEANSQNQIASHNSAFEAKKSISNISGNDNSYSAYNANLSAFEEEDKFTKIMNDPTIDLEDYPVPPVPGMYKSSTRLYIPDQFDKQIQSLLSKASEAACNADEKLAK